MNEKFETITQAIPELFDRLTGSSYFTEKGIAAQIGKSGVYVFFENDKAIHVGRTRDLSRRLREHITKNHNSASFAFKRTRRELGVIASYTKVGSRRELVKDPVFAAAFHRHVNLLRDIRVKFVEVRDPLKQYLLELYAHLEYGLELDEFETH